MHFKCISFHFIDMSFYRAGGFYGNLCLIKILLIVKCNYKMTFYASKGGKYKICVAHTTGTCLYMS